MSQAPNVSDQSRQGRLRTPARGPSTAYRQVMASMSRAEMLLAGPRGRRLCWVAVDEQSAARTGRYQLRHVQYDTDADRIHSELRRVLTNTDLSLFSDWANQVTLIELVAESVVRARYWQNPDELDRALVNGEMVEALHPVAEALAAAPASAWWSTGVDLDRQILVDWRLDDRRSPRFGGGAAVVLAEWKKQVLEDEVRLRGEHVSGAWWSPPIWTLTTKEAERWGSHRPELYRTTRSFPELGAVRLLLEEDSFGTPSALCWHLRCNRAAKVFEIQDSEDWRSLVERYSIEVTHGRRGNWLLATGLDVRWMLPDWALVAQDYDAVHLGLLGYLATSGRAIRLDAGAATLIAGWDPDATYWLTDLMTVVGEPSEWVRTDRTGHWRPKPEVGC